MDERPTSPGTPERNVTTFNSSNGPSLRRSQSSRPTSGSSPDGSVLNSHQYPSFHHISTVTIIKDNRGYGMKVSGDNPVFVQSVKEGGAAEKAGLHSGDKILKVNGTDVTHSTHTEVVELIKSSLEVQLTVQQRIPCSRPPPSSSSTSNCTNSSRCSSPMPRQWSFNASTPTGVNNIQRPRDRITAPQPVDNEQKKHFDCQREQTFRLMLEKEQSYVEALKSELAKCDSADEANIRGDLMKAERRVCTLLEQMNASNNFNNLSCSANNGLIDIQSSSTPPPPPPLSTHPSRLNNTHASLPSDSIPVNHVTSSAADIAPPLPSRNRILTSPVMVISSRSTSPPPLPPRQYLHSPISNNVEGSQEAGVASMSTDLSSPGSPLPIHHQRTKSNPDQINNNLCMSLPAEENSGSLCDLSSMKRSKGGVSWNVESPFLCTPPGTPPPPYYGTSRHHKENTVPLPPITSPLDNVDEVDRDDAANRRPMMSTDLSSPNAAIISMEDDDMSDQDMSQLGDLGPFKSISKLWEHNIHLAVFLNYVLSNCDSSSILFYLVTDLYKEGNVKEMRKWAYEIHSSFLGPEAPLRLNNVDDIIAQEINEVLRNEYDKEEILRKVFWKARLKAKEELNEQLADFQQKKTAGLGTMYGPTDTVLDECIHDKSKEQKMIEHYLVPKFEPYIEEMEKEAIDEKKYTTAAALGTILSKVFGVRGQHFNSLLERCPTFVSKEKSFKALRIGRTRKVTIRGHNFVAHQYFSVTYCRHCQEMIRGIGPQGYQCSNCCINIHRPCVKVLEESCPGPVVTKGRANDRISKLMDRIRPTETKRKPSSLNFPQFERMRKQTEDREDGSLTDNESAEKSGSSKGRQSNNTNNIDSVKEGDERLANKQFIDSERADSIFSRDLTSSHHVSPRGKSSSINRSESYKERIHSKRPLRDRRKTSDPNLSKTNTDVEIDSNAQYPYHSTNSGSSSNSNLSSRSLDSPSNSLEVVGSSNKGSCENSTVPVPSNFYSPNTNLSGSVNESSTWDSDLEAELDSSDVIASVPPDVLNNLSTIERKRQEVINELFHTERSHVRALKVLDQLFYQPMKRLQILPDDYLQLLFPNLEQLLIIHSQFNNLMKARKKENPVVAEVGDILIKTFDGNEGESFKTAAATFCCRQEIALQRFKEKRNKKDSPLHNFLKEAECNPMCRRLQLQDIIPTELQRLTKYPLLFKKLIDYTKNNADEEKHVRRALKRSTEIVTRINEAVKEAADHDLLAEIQRKLDNDKSEPSMIDELKNSEIFRRSILHHGKLNLKSAKNKVVEVHAFLFENVTILFQKPHEKYLLQHFTISNLQTESSASPIIKNESVHVRPNAREDRELYLIDSSPSRRQMYILIAASETDRDTWFRRISEAADAHKKDGKQKTSVLSVHDLDQCPNGSESPVKTKENDSSHGNNENTSSTAGVRHSQDEVVAIEPTAKKQSSGGIIGATSPGQRKNRAPTTDPPRLTTEVPLIEPSQVLVSQQAVLTAEPVLTPLEKVRRNYETINGLLFENRKLVSNILHVPKDEADEEAVAVNASSTPAHDKDATELVRAALTEVDQLTTLLNECLRVTEEDVIAASCEVNVSSSGNNGSGSATVKASTTSCRTFPSVPASKLQPITQALRMHHTILLTMWKEREEERERQRLELQRSREQLHAIHEMQQRSQRINDQTTTTTNEFSQNSDKENTETEPNNGNT